MMSEVTKSGTERAKIPDWEVAGKTGTSQSARDAWFIGFLSITLPVSGWGMMITHHSRGYWRRITS